MTLNDLEWLFCIKFCFRASFSGFRPSYQALVWKRSLHSVQDLPTLTGHSWAIQNGILIPVLMSKDPASVALLELHHADVRNRLVGRVMKANGEAWFLHGRWNVWNVQERNYILYRWFRRWRLGLQSMEYNTQKWTNKMCNILLLSSRSTLSQSAPSNITFINFAILNMCSC